MAREKRAVAPILPAPDEEGLDAHLPALGGDREDIRIAHILRVYRLAALNKGRCAQSVAQDRGGFKVQVFGSLGHLLFEVCLNLARFAREEILRLGHERGVVLLADPAYTRR